MRLLFAKRSLAYPRLAGHDLCCYHVMRELAKLQHVVGLATIEPVSAAALDRLTLDWCDTVGDVPSPGLSRPWLERRFASYFGASDRHAQGFIEAVQKFRPDAIIGMGPDIPLYIRPIPNVPRIWYTGDEFVSHYTSLVKLADVRTWTNMYTALVWALYERTFSRTLDRIWVVSERERRMMKRWGATDAVDVLANGVDSDYFAATVPEPRPGAVFWGRLDFAPNVQALQWFCSEVWPKLRARFPEAEFRIIGFYPGPEVENFTKIAGVTLSPRLEDLRPTAGQYAVAVLPFRSGGGIKNKFLEAASMGKAIVCTHFACEGLRGVPPVIPAESADEWVEAVSQLWSDRRKVEDLGSAARRWVQLEHPWSETAKGIVRAVRRLVPALALKHRSPAVPAAWIAD